jgi:hypothetical protein
VICRRLRREGEVVVAQRLGEGCPLDRLIPGEDEISAVFAGSAAAPAW